MKFNRKTHEKERIINLIDKFYDKDDLELEAIIYGIGTQHRLNYHNFVDTYQRLLEDPDLAEVKPRDALNIHFEPSSKFANIRVTILGEGSIKNYCSTNSIKNIGYNVKFMRKENFFFNGNKMGRVDVNDYYVRFNLKIEEELDPDNKLVKELKENWDNIPKSFRQKKIHTFVTQNGLFNFDLSIVKKSNTINEKMTIENVLKYRKQHLVIKPRDIKESFYDWWIDIKQDKQNKVEVSMQPSFYQKIENSNVLTNPETFEIEIELNKVDAVVSSSSLELSSDKSASKSMKKSKNEVAKIFNKFVEKVGTVLQSVQGSNYIIPESQKQHVMKEYQGLVNNNSYNLFSGPVPITLELKHIKKYTNREYADPDLENIRKDYLVTEKAHGERCLLYIANDNKVYLISRNGKGSQAIKYTGISLSGFGKTLLDGEYVNVDVNGNGIDNYLYFDVYYFRGKDVRDLPLGYHEKQKETRQNILLQIDNAIKDNDVLISVDDINQFSLYRKKFIRGDISSQKVSNPDESNNDTSIFEASYKILSKIDKLYGGLLENGHLYSYETDGLIFTPANLGVGQNYKDDDIGVLGKKIWQKVYKWKPAKRNSIDFYVRMRRNIIDKQIVDEYYNGIRYKHVLLQVSYHPTYHNDYYAQRILNEGLNKPNIEQYINFEPINPFRGYMDPNGQLINDAQISSIPTNNDDDLLTLEGEVIQEGNVVEFIYDVNETEERFKWKPLRLRENKKANGFHVATNVWNNLNNPVTTKIITTGEYDTNINCQSIKSPYDKITKPLRGFNNYVKNRLLEIVSDDMSDISLLDLCCGNTVDLKKWRYNKVKFAVAIDNNADNIHNPNTGAAIKILKHASADPELRKLARQTLLIYGDVSQNIINGNAGLDLLNKYYLNILYGNHEISGVNPKLEKLWGKGQNRFNVITCNFAIQNFFEDLETIENFMVNIAENLKSEGKFIGTCLDGETLFKELKNTEKIEGFTNTGNNLLWSITRDYKPTATYPKNHYSLGYNITTSIDSIEKDEKGYLVHFDFLVDMMNKYGLKLLDSKMFDESPVSFVETFKNDYPKAYDMLNKHKDLTKLMSMHRWFIFVKTKSKGLSELGRSSFQSGLFDVSISSSRKSTREISKPDPLTESISERLLPEDIDYDEEESDVSEYKSEMSYDYDNTIPTKKEVKAQKKVIKDLLEEKTNTKSNSKSKTKKKSKILDILDLDIHKPNVSLSISKKRTKTKNEKKQK